MNDVSLNPEIVELEAEMEYEMPQYPVIPNPEGEPTEEITKMEIDDVIYEVTDAEARATLPTKVDKVEGKGLSTNDYDNTDKAIVDGVTSALDGKVDKVQGKGLSTNDFTDEEKTIVDGIPSALELKADKSDTYTKSEVNSALDNKVDKVEGKGLSENDFTDSLKSKLDGIEAEANKTVVDNSVTSTSTNPVESKAIYNLLNDLLPEATATGNPILITNASGLNAKSLKVELEPIQDLHGYDSPWVGGSGKNKAVFEDSFIVSSRNYTKTVDGNGIKVKSTGSNGRVGYSYPLEANTNYTVSFKLKKTNIDVTSRVYIATENDVWSGSASGFVASFEATTTETTKSQLVTTTSSSLIFIGVLAGSEGGEIIVTDLQIEVGNQATTYEPYSNICPISGRTQTTVSVNSEDTTIQFGQTVYGGEVKSQGGTDNKWKLLKKKLSDANKVETEGETYKRYRILIESEGIDTAKRTQTLCDKTSFVNSGGEYIHFNINSQGVYIYIYAPNDMATTEEFEFCIPLATPTTVNTPAFNIPLNKANNTLTADGDMELIYSKTPQ